MKKIHERHWYVFLKLLFTILPLIVLVIGLSVLTYRSIVDESVDIITAVKNQIIPMGTALFIFILAKYIDDYIADSDKEKELQEIKDTIATATKLQEVKDAVATIATANHDCHCKFQDDISNLNKDIKHFNNTSMEVLTTYDDFYRKLQKSRSAAQEKVQLTQLDPCPPLAYGDERTRKEYFEGDIACYKSRPYVNFYRILSIETEEKLEWARSLIEGTKGLSNVFLAYINIESIEKMTPFPKMLSLQIIDCKEVFVLNPKYSYMPHDYKRCYYFKNNDVAQIYSDYYEAIWETLRSDIQHGCILKDGNSSHGYEEKLNKIKLAREWMNQCVPSVAQT